MAPVLLVSSEKDADQIVGRLSPDRRGALGAPMTPEQAAEKLQPLMAAGIRGFTFGNQNLHSPELIAAAGELKRLLS